MKQSCDVDVHVHLIVLCHKTFYENLLLNVYRVCNDKRDCSVQRAVSIIISNRRL